MIQKIKLLVIVLLLLTFNACNKDDDSSTNSQSQSINKILALGASRVEGSRPEFESYRYELWKDLKENNWIFDFIGTQTDESSYPTFNNMNFDVDHEGRSGWTSGEILNGLGDWLNQAGSADIVLLSSPGGNDALQGLPYSQAVSNINYIIDIFQADNPSITIILEQMAPGRSDIMTSELTEFFTQMQKEVLNIAANKTTTTSSVMAVDMFTGFNDNLLADDVHYNEAGAVFIANRYYTILINVLE
ncbi:GDSL-type esterase/lipase family protein [bacterium]|nr:GDSL-type esterase/lipase family protein [bacterium]MDA9803107.1 GDSL-type esterase/lipase family protein [Flavobacteriaceae bacterium]